jgi:peroxiredoxin
MADPNASPGSCFHGGGRGVAMAATPAFVRSGTRVASAVEHLRGVHLPNLALPSTLGGTVSLRDLGGLAVVLVYSLTERPRASDILGWDGVTGAQDCTAEICAFKERHEAFELTGARVYGLSSQGREHQLEAAQRLRLPFALLSDGRLELADSIGLPTFEVAGLHLYQRATVVVVGGVIQHVFYPVAEAGEHERVVLSWLSTTSLLG